MAALVLKVGKYTLYQMNGLKNTIKTPWKDKVTIVNKFVGNADNEKCVTLDKFFADKELDSIKADIEGAEVDMVLGAKNCLENKIKSVNICVYHDYDDERKITGFLLEHNFDIKVNPGLMWCYKHERPLERQFVHGVVYGTKHEYADESL